MFEPKEFVSPRYIGEEGKSYHDSTHGYPQRIEDAISRSRQREFAPSILPQDRVLEFGVGKGYNLRYIECALKVGFDVAECCREYCEPYGIEFESDFRQLAGRDFDVIVCHHVLEHTLNPLGVLRFLGELLVPGGRLLLHLPLDTNRRYNRYSSRDPNMHLYSWNAQSAGNLVSAAGSYHIKSISIRPFGYEGFCAPISLISCMAYRTALLILRALRPVHEIAVCAFRSNE